MRRPVRERAFLALVLEQVGDFVEVLVGLAYGRVEFGRVFAVDANHAVVSHVSANAAFAELVGEGLVVVLQVGAAAFRLRAADEADTDRQCQKDSQAGLGAMAMLVRAANADIGRSFHSRHMLAT